MTRSHSRVRSVGLAIRGVGLTLALLTSVLAAAPAAQAVEDGIVISELFYNPDGSEEGSEFVELYNATSSSIDLSGWTIEGVGGVVPPVGPLEAGGYFVVARDAIAFNASFGASPDATFSGKLNNGGERVAVLDTSGAIVDEVVYDDQSPWPLRPDGDGDSLQLLDLTSDNAVAPSWGEGTPTPGATNSAAAGQPAAPTVQFGRGMYDGPVTETLGSATPGAQIRYTLDGERPTAASTLYTGPFRIEPNAYSAATLRAVSISGGKESLETAHTYLFNTGLVEAGFDTLPSVSIRFDGGIHPTCSAAYPFVCDRHRASIDYIDPGTGDGFGVTAAIGLFGSSSVRMPKNSYRIYFEDEWGVETLNYDIFGEVGFGPFDPVDFFDKLELRAQSQEGPFGVHPRHYFVSDRWIKDGVLELGSLTPHGRVVNVFMNGRYHGVYDLRERFDAQWFASYGEGEPTDYDSVYWNGYFGRVIGINEGTDDLWNKVFAAATYDEVRDLVNPTALIHQAMIDSLTGRSFEQEYRFVGAQDPAHPDDAILMHNDNDQTFGSDWDIFWQPGGPSRHVLPWLYRWRNDPELKQLAYDATAKAFCGDGAMTTAKALERFDRIVAANRLAMSADIARWGPNNFESVIPLARSRVQSGMTTMHAGWQAEGFFLGCAAGLSPQLAGPTDLVVYSGTALDVPLGLFDADGDDFTVSATGLPPGLGVTADGRVTGAGGQAGNWTATVRAEDDGGRWSTHDIEVTVLDGGQRIEAPAVVLNEYNAVNANDGLWEGTDVAFPNDPTNGGDWFELVTVTDFLDLRGWTVELWDRDRNSERLKLADTYEFADADVWSELVSGSLITIAEEVPTDASYFPESGDWEITARPGDGLLIGGSGFDTTRRDFHIVVRNAEGTVVGPAMGETEAWRFGSEPFRNVTGSEVYALCSAPTPGVDLLAASQDFASQSTFGKPNVCDGVVQDLEGFRPDIEGVAGDVDDSGELDARDVVAILQNNVGDRPSPFRSRIADKNANGTVDLLDALILARELANAP